MKYIRSLKNDETGAVVVSRLLALTIPLIIVGIFHIANGLGMGVPQFLLEPVIAVGIIGSGMIIAVLGMKAGLLPVFLLFCGLWAVVLYVYFQFVIDLL